MALQVTYQEDPNTPFSSEGSFSNPLCFTFDGVRGGEKTANLLIKNMDSSPVEITTVSMHGVHSDLDFLFSTDNSVWSSSLTLNETLDGLGQGDDTISVYLKVKAVDLPISIKSIQNLKLRISTS